MSTTSQFVQTVISDTDAEHIEVKTRVEAWKTQNPDPEVVYDDTNRTVTITFPATTVNLLG